jgi:hypothetical protein
LSGRGAEGHVLFVLEHQGICVTMCETRMTGPPVIRRVPNETGSHRILVDVTATRDEIA